MGKKRRSRRSRKRFRFAFPILIFSFCTLLFLLTQLPHALQLPNNQLLKTALKTMTNSSTASSTSSTNSSFPPKHVQHKQQSWFQSTASESRQSSNTRSSTKSASHGTTPILHSREIPRGPYPLIPLNRSDSTAHEGTSWAASITKRAANNLPLHWLAELLHAQPSTPPQPESSIFTARRKGAWIGCDRETWLVCKGAYRAIKKTNSITIVDTSCAANKRWLPHIMKKLTQEFRLVRLTCLGKRVDGYDEKVRFLEMDALSDALPNGTDLLIAYKFVESGTLISAMKLFKNVKKAGVKYLLTENFPEEENVVKKVGTKNVLRLNVAMPPFWFPAPEYEYENKGENSEAVAMQILVSRVADLFEEKLTPGMAELVDPRKRIVRE